MGDALDDRSRTLEDIHPIDRKKRLSVKTSSVLQRCRIFLAPLPSIQLLSQASFDKAPLDIGQSALQQLPVTFDIRLAAPFEVLLLLQLHPSAPNPSLASRSRPPRWRESNTSIALSEASRLEMVLLVASSFSHSSISRRMIYLLCEISVGNGSACATISIL
jgi:hypothetical protein